jgi:hypothetical protein
LSSLGLVRLLTVFNHTPNWQRLSIYISSQLSPTPSENLFLISLFGTYTPPQLASPLMTIIWEAIGTIAPCDSFTRYKRAYIPVWGVKHFYFIAATSWFNRSGSAPLQTLSLLLRLLDTPTFHLPRQYVQENIRLHTPCPKLLHFLARDTHTLDGSLPSGGDPFHFLASPDADSTVST